MEREAKMLDVPNKKIVGISVKKPPQTTKEDIIVNIGYCGGYKVPVGTIVEPSFAINSKTNDIIRIDTAFDEKRFLCITTDKFVEEPLAEFVSVYDMELFKLAKLPHKRILALKIVSDNLDEKQCEAFNSKAAWARVQKIINEFLEKNE